MARWDNILTLPVQEPSSTEFSSSDLTWHKVEGWRQNIDDVALIPYSRVDDFVRGESANEECPTKFRVEARRRKAEGTSCKPRVDGYLEYILYWCSYGPDDHRKGGTSRPSRKCIKPSMKKSPAGRPHTKRGCLCHFIVKRLSAQPSVAMIIYNHRKHVDKKDNPCHGSLDNKAIGTPAMFAPFISEELRQRITSLLHLGYSVESIMDSHAKTIERHGGPSNRDDFVSLRFVRTLERDMRRYTYGHTRDDMLNIKAWVENNQNQVFYYQEQTAAAPFILGIQTEWQLQQMVRFGKNGLMALDSGFRAKKLKFPVSSLLVFDSNNIAIPIAWIITAGPAFRNLDQWMQALCERVHTKNANWNLDGFIVDDALIKIETISRLFQCSVLLCVRHVRRAWHKAVLKKCPNTEIQREMLKRLGQLMRGALSGSTTMDAFHEFLEDFVDYKEVVSYFRTHWMQSIESWFNAMMLLPIASCEASVVIEAYRLKLKSRLLNEEDTHIYQRADWLVHKLFSAIYSFYWYDSFTEENDLCGYLKDEELASTAWHKALCISDSDVMMNEHDLESAKVVSQSDRCLVHTVWNPGSEFSFCDCSWFMKGYVCKHVTKVCMLLQNYEEAKPSMATQTYHKALQSLLSFPSNGSVVLDHSLVLAIKMQQDMRQILGIPRDDNVNSLNPDSLKWVCKRSRAFKYRKSSVDGNPSSSENRSLSIVENAVPL